MVDERMLDETRSQVLMLEAAKEQAGSQQG
jgi:hypothetical protein